ncbi:MAG: EthD domain-containing protein [Novosphingobium sp.]
MASYKLFGLIPRKPELTSEEFHDYYRHPHGTMGRNVTTMRAYVQSHQIHTDKLGSDQNVFEAVAEVWMDNLEDINNFRTERIIKKYILEDEPIFIDMERLEFFIGEEEVVTSGPRQEIGLHPGDELWNPANRPTSVKLLHFIRPDGNPDWASPDDKEIGLELGALRHVRCHPFRDFHGESPSFLGVQELWWPSRTVFHRAVEAKSAVFREFLERAGNSVTLLANAERWI